MTIMSDKTPPIERSTASSQATKKRQTPPIKSSPKKLPEIDAEVGGVQSFTTTLAETLIIFDPLSANCFDGLQFFTNLFAEKVPKAKYEEVRRRSQTLEGQMHRQQIDFQRCQDAQAVLINTLLKKHERLRALIGSGESLPSLSGISSNPTVKKAA